MLEALRRGAFEAVASRALADEVAEVLRRPRFRAAGVSEGHVLEVLRLLAPFVKDTEVQFPIRDPRDVPLLSAAVPGGAGIIVTGDPDFLEDTRLRALLEGRGIAVENPREFLRRIGG